MSKKVGSARARDRARHEEEILAAAERVFAQKGYEGATMAAVAAEAGFAIGTLYNIFEAKDAILERLLLRHLEAVEREVDAVSAKAKNPREELEEISLARARYFGANRDFFRLYVAEVPGLTQGGHHAGPAILASMERQLDRHREIFARLGPKPGVDDATRALVFYAATRAYVVEKILRANRPPRLAEMTALVRALLDGLG